MLIGLYGGTFDPVHLGHTNAAMQVKDALGLSQVHLVLAARPGHRSEPRESEEDRWRMLCLACEEHDGLFADDTELRRDGTSYTYDTLAGIGAKKRGIIPCWILGQDAFATLPSWYRWRDLLGLCNLIVVERPGDVRKEGAELSALCAQHEVDQLTETEVGQVYRLHLPMKQLSATQIRADIAAGNEVQHLLAPRVCAYINEHQLYGKSENVV